MDVLFNIIWYIFKDNEKFNLVQPGDADDCLKAVVYVPGGYLAYNRLK